MLILTMYLSVPSWLWDKMAQVYGDKALALTIACLFICCIFPVRVVCLQTLHAYIPTFLHSCTEFSLCENNETYSTLNNNSTRPTSHGRRKWGKRAAVLARFRTWTQRPPLPAIFLSNVRSLTYKHDELSYLIMMRRDFSDFCVLLHRNLAWPLDPRLSCPSFWVHTPQSRPLARTIRQMERWRSVSW